MSDAEEPSAPPGVGIDEAGDQTGAGRESMGGKARRGPGRRNIFARLALFLRQVVAELRKVIWPTRRDLVSYTWIVVVFCVIMAGFVALCDFVFGKGVLYVFGG